MLLALNGQHFTLLPCASILNVLVGARTFNMLAHDKSVKSLLALSSLLEAVH